MNTNVIFEDEAKQRLLIGVEKLSDAVKVTMGPRGRNVLIHKANTYPHLTKDGVTVAKSVNPKDYIESMGAEFVKQAAFNTARDAGDGTSTATLLTATMFKLGLSELKNGASPVEVKRGMEAACNDIIKRLETDAIKIPRGSKRILNIATISANGDGLIADTIFDVTNKVGKHGLVIVKESNLTTDKVDIINGMRLKSTYTSHMFRDNINKKIDEVLNPYIYCVSGTLQYNDEVLTQMNLASEQGVPLVYIVEDIDKKLEEMFIANKLEAKLDIRVIKVPGYGSNKKLYLNDITQYIGESGKVDKIIIGDKETVIFKDEHDDQKLKAYVKTLEEVLITTEKTFDKEVLEERIASLSGGIAIIHVGATTSIEMKERKDRYDDCIKAVNSALEEGIIVGGGYGLYMISKNLEAPSSKPIDFILGYNLVLKTAEAPARQIALNSGIEEEKYLYVNTDVSYENFIGLSVVTYNPIILLDEGIVDPVKVEIVAMKNAVSAASMLLTTEAVVIPDDTGGITYES